jgi:glycine dehydrogenase subunit 2
VYDAPMNPPGTYCMHECMLTDTLQHQYGVTAIDISKRLIDFGFHPPTYDFPQKGVLLVEPTETVSKEELDAFISAMRTIAQEAKEDPKILKSAPHTTPVRRLSKKTGYKASAFRHYSNET